MSRSRLIFTVGASLYLAGCASSSLSTNESGITSRPTAWKVERKRDRLTDHVGVSASVISSNVKITSNLGRFNSAVLSVTCIAKSPTVMILFGWPIGRDGIAVASYRVDQNPAQSPKIKFIGTDAFTIEGQDARILIDEISNAQLLYVQVSATTGNQATADFNVAGGSEAIQQVINECPFETLQNSSSKKRR